MSYDYGGGGGSMSPADFNALMGNRNADGGFGGLGGMMAMFYMLIMFFFFFQNGGLFQNGRFGNGGAMPFIAAQDTQAEVQRGFNQQQLVAGIGNLNNTVSSGFANAEVGNCNRQMALMQTLNGNQMNLQQTLNQNQLGLYQGLNQIVLGQQVANSANQAGLADLKYTVATENCSDRQVVNNGVRDIIASNTANTQAIINSQNQGFQALQDKLCQLELDSYKQKNAEQAAEIVSLRGVISQSEQTAKLIQDNNQQTATLIQRIAPPPVPAYPAQGYGQLFGGCCGRAV